MAKSMTDYECVSVNIFSILCSDVSVVISVVYTRLSFTLHLLDFIRRLLISNGRLDYPQHS